MDRETFEALYLELETPLYNTVYRWVWREQEAMDLVQEAFVRLWETRAQVRVAEAKAYVFRIGLNLASNRLRALKLRQWVGLTQSAYSLNSPERSFLGNEREQAVRRAILALPNKIREIVVLVRFAEMSYREIGALLKIPEGTVGSRHNRGMALLKDRLRDLKN